MAGRHQPDGVRPSAFGASSGWRLSDPSGQSGNKQPYVGEDDECASLSLAAPTRRGCSCWRSARAAIDLYAGRLALSEEELRLAREGDAAVPAEAAAPLRIILVGQVNAGKSSLVNALAQETQCAVGPVPTTSQVAEYRLELDGRPAVSLVDMPGLDEKAERAFLAQAERADLVLWVASATQPARGPDRKGLDDFRAWARTLLTRRPPPVILALTHVDELRPANEWGAAL